ncbi:nuclear transport factor 2 family protein [Streptomyces sp. M10(2022)]
MTVESVGTAEHTLHRPRFAALYVQVQQFYAHRMQILDTHDTGRLADTYTEDAVLEPPSPAAPVRAGAGLTTTCAPARNAGAGSRLHHWVGMLDVQPQPDGSLHTSCSALAYVTPSAGGPKVLHVCVMQDVLVRCRGRWRTAHRRVTRDDLA